MGRKGAGRQGLELVADLPWPWGVGLAGASWWVLHWLAGSSALLPHVIGTVFQFIAPPLLLLMALVSWLRARKAVVLLASDRPASLKPSRSLRRRLQASVPGGAVSTRLGVWSSPTRISGMIVSTGSVRMNEGATRRQGSLYRTRRRDERAEENTR